MYETLQIEGEGRRTFSIVLPRDKGRHAAELAATIRRNSDYHQGPHLGVLVLDYLKGAGTLVDVGANIGLGAIPAAVYGSNVVAIELLAENCFCLTLAALENRLANISVFQMAAGEERRMAGVAGGEAWGHVVQPGNGQSAMMLPLDDIVELADLQRGGTAGPFVRRPVLLKIDTEGYELPVLMGASRLIARLDPALVVECAMIEGGDDPTSRRGRALKQHLESSGYHLYLHRGDRLVPRRADDVQEGHVCDILALRKACREGDRIGRFTVARLSVAESARWVGEMVACPTPPHRLHAAGVLARWHAEGRAMAELPALCRRLIDDPDPEVAANAARLLGATAGR